MATTRVHAVLNSLSLDFISVSFASLLDAGTFLEIGKRSVWALERRMASVPGSEYGVIAIDAD